MWQCVRPLNQAFNRAERGQFIFAQEPYVWRDPIAEKTMRLFLFWQKSPTCEGFLYQKRPRILYFVCAKELRVAIWDGFLLQKRPEDSLFFLQKSSFCDGFLLQKLLKTEESLFFACKRALFVKGSCCRKDRWDFVFVWKRARCVKCSCRRKD